MTKSERTGLRSTNYSSFHRTLPSDCYVMDIDWVECRNGIPKAIFETSEINYQYVNEGEDPYLKTLWFVLRRTWFQRSILSYLSKKLNINAYIVIHDPSPNPEKFLVVMIDDQLNIYDWKNSRFSDISRVFYIEYSRTEYENFLVKL